MRLLARNAAAASFTVTIAFSFRGRRGRLSGSAHLGFDGKEIASIHAGAKVPSARCRRAEPCVPTGAVGGTGSGRSALVVAGPPFEKCHRPNGDRKSTRLNSSHTVISYAVFCLKKKKTNCNYYGVFGKKLNYPPVKLPQLPS